MSFFRNCNKCGKTISFRQMPGGHWVAFDPGSDIPHQCNKKRKVKKNPKEAIIEKTHNSNERDLSHWKELPETPPDQLWISSDRNAKAIYNAIKDNYKLEIVYSEGEDPTTKRIIEPRKLFDRAGNHYLDAYCHLRNGPRIFRVDKIVSINPLITNDTIIKPNDTRTFPQPSYRQKPSPQHQTIPAQGNQTSVNIIFKLIGWAIFIVFVVYMLLQ